MQPVRRSRLTHGRFHPFLRDKPKRTFHQQRAYQKTRYCCGCTIGSMECAVPARRASILEILRQAPKLISPYDSFSGGVSDGRKSWGAGGYSSVPHPRRIPKPLRMDTAPITGGIRTIPYGIRASRGLCGDLCDGLGGEVFWRVHQLRSHPPQE